MGLTQDELAAKLQITIRTVQRRESGETRVSAEAELAIQRLAELMVAGGAIIV